MYNPNNEKLIAWTKYVLICGGFWNQPITNNIGLQNVFKMYSLLMKIAYSMLWFMLACELIRLIANGYELTIIIASFSVVANALKITTKAVLYLKYNILELFKDVIAKEEEIWASNNEEIKTLYRGKIRICKLFVLALVSSTILTVGMLEGSGTKEVFKTIEHNKIHNDTIEPHVMYQTLIPLNKLDHLYWLFATQALWTWAGITYNCVTHLIFLTILVYAASQLEILQIRLRNYVEPDFSTDASKEEIREKIQVLRGLILDHNYIIRFVQHFNKCTKYIIMLEFMLSSLNLASVSVSVNLTKMEPSEIVWLLFFFLLLGMQIFLIGWNCNEIKIQSEAIGDAAFESKWYLLNKEAKQMTQIMIARAQRPLLMTIGPFGPMTTDSILLVVKATYSYISIMKK